MTPNEALILFVIAVGIGTAIGWAIWGMPAMFARQRGIELDDDGYTICKKEIAEAGRKALGL